MASELTPEAAQQRVIRVFVSSTFKDMQAEREELVKRVFPQLRKLCEERGVTWGEVDLRWGITEEQAAEGQVLPICLQEIHRCRPYFIGLLGQRYGWVPDEIPQELVELEPWLAEHLEHSVTELEILHGVLNNPQMSEHAYFYFRDPSYVENLPAAEQAAYLEGPAPYEIEQLGPEEAERRAEGRIEKLVALKDRIRKSSFPVHEDYQDPVQLGELILQDLTALIDRMFPSGSEPDPLDREAAEHEAFAASRAGVYIGRQEYFDRLDAHAEDTDPPLTVLGESGSGKSALLANWALRYRASHPDDLLIMHFIGASSDSADWAAMLRRTMGELQRRFDIDEEIPGESLALRAAFAEWLQLAAAGGRVVLILDGLNQLEDREGAPDLVWLPSHFPINVRVILSTLPGRPLDEIEKRAWPTLQVEPLEAEERIRLVTEYLGRYSKTLSAERIARIASAPQTASPLYLRALLEELRVFGIHEELDRRIGHYLAASTVGELYERILQRYEDDYERDRPRLVGDTMSLLWAARRGLSEAELLELLGTDSEPLPGAYWAPLYLAAEQSLVSRAGLIGFFHDYLRHAVQNRYLATEREQRAAHLLLADYFGGQRAIRQRLTEAALDEGGLPWQTDELPRQTDELPWQLARARAWPRLYDLLAKLEFFYLAWNASQADVQSYWTQVEANSSLRLLDAYRPVLKGPVSFVDPVMEICDLLLKTGHLHEAQALAERLIEEVDRDDPLESYLLPIAHLFLGNLLIDQGDLDGGMAHLEEHEQLMRDEWEDLAEDLQVTLWGRARILEGRGDTDGAMRLLKEAERLFRESGHRDGLAGCLGRQAWLLLQSGDLDGAMALNEEQEQLYRAMGDKVGLSSCLSEQAMILRERGDLDGAVSRYEQHQRLCRELGDKPGLAVCLGRQGLALGDQGDLDGAMALYKEEEQLCLDLGYRGQLANSFNNQAVILLKRDDLDGALSLFEAGGRISEELGDQRLFARSLGNQALVVRDLGNLDKAMALHKDEELIWRKLGDKQGLSQSLGNQAGVLYLGGDLDGAMGLYQKQQEICEELADKEGLARCLENQALILEERGDQDGATALREEERRAWRDSGNRQERAQSLHDQARSLKERGDLQAAIALYQEEEQLRREMGDKVALAACLGSQGVALYNVGILDRAMAAYEEEAQIRHELGDRQGVARSLGNQALILKQRRDLEGAMALYAEQERLRRDLGDSEGVARSLQSQALTMHDLGDGEKALPLFKQEEQLRRELGDGEGLASSLGSQGVVLKQQGDLDGALALYREQERISREEGYRGELARSLSNQGQILKQRGDLDAAVGLWGEEERLRRELGDEQKLALCLHRRALTLHELGVGEKALPLFKEEEQLRRELGDRKGLADSLGSQAVILGQQGDLEEAMAVLHEQEQICRELGDKRRLAGSLANQAAILRQGGDLDRVMVLLQEESEIRRGLGDKQKLVPSLDNQAAILRDRKDHAGALALYEELEQILRKLGDKRVLHMCLGNQAHILALRKERVAALDLYREKEQLCRELDDQDGRARSLCNQAVLLANLGKPDEALPLVEDARSLVESHGLTSLAAQAQRILDFVRSKSAD